jgi:hypothetical protein
VTDYTEREWELRLSQERLLACEPGRLAVAKISRLDRIGRIFTRNSDALRLHLDRTNDPAISLPLWSPSNTAGFEEYMDEVEWLLFNYLAAAEAKIDHLRIFIRANWDQDSDFSVTYRRRVKEEFEVAPLHNWLKKLRNCMLHYRLPVSTGKLSAGQDSGWSTAVMLHADDLAQYDEWNAKAKAYMTAHGPEIDLGHAISAYSDQVLLFDRWVRDEFTGANHDQIAAYRTAFATHFDLLVSLGLVQAQDMPPSPGIALDRQAPGTAPASGRPVSSQRVPSSNFLAWSVSWPPGRPGGALVSRPRCRASYRSPRTDETLTVISSARAAAGAWSALVSSWTYRAATWA